MKIENPVAFSFIMQDDIYLLNKEKTLYIADTATVQVAEIPLPIAETPPKLDFTFIGGHKSNFLIIVHYPQLEFIDDKHLTALQSVLGRLEFSLDDVAIFNMARYPDASFEYLNDFFRPQKMLLLGKQALPNGLEALTFNKPLQLNGCKTLFSFSFDEMMDNNENKKVFWEQMKQL